MALFCSSQALQLEAQAGDFISVGPDLSFEQIEKRIVDMRLQRVFTERSMRGSTSNLIRPTSPPAWTKLSRWSELLSETTT